MKKRILLCLVSLLGGLLYLQAQSQNEAYLDYIQKFKDVAVREMKEYGIPASITLAQGLLESGAGSSDLAKGANNHFGIKCNSDWTGSTMFHDDDKKGECFRSYNDPVQSYEDHSKFLAFRPRYSFLFDYAPNDYKSWAFGLKQAGYATDPKYPTRLIKIIEDYQLYSFDSSERVARKKAPTDGQSVKNASQSNQNTGSTALETEKKKNKSIFDFLIPKKRTHAPDTIKDKVFSGGAYIAEIPAFQRHKVDKINGVKYVIAEQGDTYASIAEEFEMFEKELLKANDRQYGENPQPGDIVFLSKKKKYGEKEFHTFAEGDSMYKISQTYGIRVRSLYRLNEIVFGKEPAAGTLLKLR